MQIKNNFKYIIFILVSFIILNTNIKADEFNITAQEIIIDKENEVLIGKGSVQAVDKDGNIIYANKITYEKSKEFLVAEGRVKIKDNDGNILETNKATYDKKNEKINTYKKTKLIMNEGYELETKNIFYDYAKKIISSKQDSILYDSDGNVVETTMFEYQIQNSLYSSIGDIKITDVNKNRYFFKEIYVDTKNKEMIGSDVSVVLDQKNIGLNKENDPRFAANSIFITKNKSDLTKGVFTVCKKKDEKCPAWSIKAKEISHDKIKKTIYYKNAILKVYDIPIFYLPRFFHPDPTVKRQSGFLIPFFTNGTSVGSAYATPYFWAINNDKDLTFTPKFYTKENLLMLGEYRQALENGFLTLDASYTEGYKNPTSKKTDGTRNHIFANLDLNINQSDDYKSNFKINLEHVSNDTYFRVHDINTELVNKENTILKNEIEYSFNTKDKFLNVSTSVYENLREKKNSNKYEYIAPNIDFGKSFFSDKFGFIDLETNAFNSKYETNKQKTFLTNNLIWSPPINATKYGFINTLQGMLKNTNYETLNTNEFREDGTVNELSGVLSHKTSLPMKKNGLNYSNFLSPSFMIRYAPGNMRDLSKKEQTFNYSDLYALNRTSEIERGLNAILGVDFKINETSTNKEKFALSFGQVFSKDKNQDIPSKSSLDQKMSDVVGEIKYNFSEIGHIDYKFNLDHNLNDLNYNEISTELNFGAVQFNLDYLEELNHVGSEHYASSGITLNFNEQNKLTFETKKNFKTDSTELYNLSYQYNIDCLTAGLAYRREFYRDSEDLENSDTLMFSITFVPLGKANTPAINQ